MILGPERLKEEVSAPRSLDTHSNLWEFTRSHLLSQVYVLHGAGKWKRPVRYKNVVPADLAILSILTPRSCIGLLANRLHANHQLEVTEYSPWLDFKVLCEQLNILSSILKARQRRILGHSAFRQRHDPDLPQTREGNRRHEIQATCLECRISRRPFLTWVPVLILTHHTQLPLHLFFPKSDQTFGGTFFFSRQALPLKHGK